MSENLSPFLANSLKTGRLQEKRSSLRLKMSENLSPFLANPLKTGCLQEKYSSLRFKMSEKENYFTCEPRFAAGNSHSRRSAAPSDPIRGRELTLEAGGRTF